MIRIWSGSALARPTTVRALPGATGSTSRPTAGGPGPRRGFGSRSRLPGSSSIRPTTTSSTSRLLATCGGRAASGGSTRPPMGASAGPRCSTWGRTRAAPNSSWIPPTTRSSTPPPISGGGPASASTVADPTAVCGRRRTAGGLGAAWRADCRRARSAGSGSTSSGPTRTSSTSGSSTTSRVASIGRTMPGRPGARWGRTTAGRCTSGSSRSIRSTTSGSICPRRRCRSRTTAGRRSDPTAPSEFTSTITRCGSIRPIRTT